VNRSLTTVAIVNSSRYRVRDNHHVQITLIHHIPRDPRRVLPGKSAHESNWYKKQSSSSPNITQARHFAKGDNHR